MREDCKCACCQADKKIEEGLASGELFEIFWDTRRFPESYVSHIVDPHAVAVLMEELASTDARSVLWN